MVDTAVTYACDAALALGAALAVKDIVRNYFFGVPKDNMLNRYWFSNRSLRNKYRGVKTALGMTIEQVVASGVQNPDSSIGVYAGDAESYSTFGELFETIIRDYHRIKGELKSRHDLTPVSFENLDPEGKRINSTRIRVARNMDGYAFPALISLEDRLKTAKMIEEALNTMPAEQGLAGSYYPLKGMTKETQKQLIEDHFLFKEGDRFLAAAGINRDWPEGRGIFHNQEKTFLVWTHEEDMLRIISMQNGGDVSAVFNRLSAALNHITKTLKFAYSEKFGYLTSCPTNLGTGIRASVHVKLPLLSAVAGFEKFCKGLQLSVRGIDGEHSESKGGVYDISNEGRLGLTEVEYVTILVNGVKKLIELEKSLEEGKTVKL